MSEYDLQAERTLAVTLVTRPDAFDLCAASLDRAMFADELAGRIYAAVEDLLIANRPVSALTVQARMVEGKGGSVVPGWNKGVAARNEEVPVLAGRVREMWGRREIVALAETSGRLALEQGVEAATKSIGETLARVAAKPGGRARSMTELTADYMTELKADMDDPTRRVAFETGYGLVDKHTGGLRPGVLWVLAARPGSGKTSFVVGIAAHLARSGVPVGVFWLEDDWHDAVRRYHQTRNGLRAEELRGSPREALQHMNRVALGHASEMDRIWVDDTHGLTVNDIAARMRRMAREHGCRVFIADHLGEMRVEREERWGDRHDLAIGKAARVFRDAAKDLKAAPVLVSQMNRQIERRADGAPRMSDLDGSGQVEQAARVIAFLSKPERDDGTPTGEFVVSIEKNTNGRTGPIALRWCPEQMTVENP